MPQSRNCLEAEEKVVTEEGPIQEEVNFRPWKDTIGNYGSVFLSPENWTI